MVLAGVVFSFGLALPSHSNAATDDGPGDIRLELSPRICTLATNDTQCDTLIHATWRAPRDESLCLIIVGRPEVRRCWENYSAGTYSIELIFSSDLIFQLQDLDQQRVLTSEVLRVIREAIRFRHKRREPWDLFD
jgi:hypothetical protein